MSHPTRRMPVVAVFNSHREFIGAPRAALDGEGVPTVAALLAEIPDGTLYRIGEVMDAVRHALSDQRRRVKVTPAVGGDVYLGGISVLVVDDCPRVRSTVTAMLEHYGAAVTAVASADEALESLERERPDVLVSDLAMPGKGGYWLIGQVRALPPERGGSTPAAALTGFTGPEHRASILRAGFQYHVEKPVSLRMLAEVVALLALKAQVPPQG